MLSLFRKTLRLYHTLKHLKLIQVYFRLKYTFLYLLGLNKINYHRQRKCATNRIVLQYQISVNKSFFKADSFSFLNIEHTFHSGIDWEYSKYGKLWQYNLCYFDFLLQDDISSEQGMKLIDDFINQSHKFKYCNDPYPISLRVINWILFINKHNLLDNEKYKNAIYNQSYYLSKRLEYHLLANHLLENACSLLFIAYFFKDKSIFKKASKLLNRELNEQILGDGAHFELSPMYHQIILYKLLLCIDLIKNNPAFVGEDLLLTILTGKASAMLGWLEKITLSNGEIPMFNDAAFRISPNTDVLKGYSNSLNVISKESYLSESGYRKFLVGKMECIFDIGVIQPAYQPGHAHADLFSFVLTDQSTSIIVDTGTSTYENNSRRRIERSTQSHNVVTVEGLNESDVWGGFRVGRRATPIIKEDSKNKLVGSHNGYLHKGIVYERIVNIENNTIQIIDYVESVLKVNAEFNLHFHPKVRVKIFENHIEANNIKVVFKNFEKIVLKPYQFANGFNKLETSSKVVVSFTERLVSTIMPIL